MDQFLRWFNFDGLGEKDVDDRIMEQEKEDQIVSKLHNILQPFLLRRLKSDVELKIPPKKELVLYVPLSSSQSDMYASLLNRTLLDKIKRRDEKLNGGLGDSAAGSEGGTKQPLIPRKRTKSTSYRETSDREFFQKLDKGEDTGEIWTDAASPSGSKASMAATPTSSIVNVKMTNIMMQLRKCCNHPYLCDWPKDADGDAVVDESLVTSCGKMMLLDRMLTKLKKGGHKVLIFSQFTTMLDILEDYFAVREHQVGFSFFSLPSCPCRLTGPGLVPAPAPTLTHALAPCPKANPFSCVCVPWL